MTRHRAFRLALVGGLAAVAAVAVASATLGAESSPDAGDRSAATKGPLAATPSRARLDVTSLSPLRVRGSGFKPGERVRVTLTESDEGAAGQKRVTATGAGSLVVSFGADACGGFSVAAVGDKGSRASLQFSSFTC